MSNHRLLICYAHPDDESFGLGGLISKYVAEGIDVYLICATDGAVGSLHGEFDDNGQSMREIRLAELACANEVLQFKHVFQFDYRDSGMMGSEDNKNPDSLWANWQTKPEEVTRQVVEVMREIQPQVVITFNEYGGYGHPDHIAIQQATVQAMRYANDASYTVNGNLPPYAPQKLYYSSIARLSIRLGILRTRLQGKDPRKLGRNQDIDMIKILENAIEPTTMVDIREYFEAWAEASACHVSQGGGRSSFLGLPVWMRKVLFPKQGFTRIHPSANGKIEQDLFEQVTAEPIRVVKPK